MKRRTIDASEVSRLKASVSLASLIGAETTLEKHGAEYLALCPFHAEETPSFRIYRDNHYHCFGCGEHGDAIEWLRNRQSMSFAGAVRHLRECAGLPDPAPSTIERISKGVECDWCPILPVPADAPPLIAGNGWTCRIFNPKRAGEPKEWTSWRPQLDHRYLDADGALLGYVLRIVPPGAKKFTPAVTFCANGAGERRWCIVPLPRPRALYGLDRLAAHPTATVALVEGEKTCDAARRLLPSFVAVTWAGGAKAYQHSGWSPLAGRNVVCIPDADAEGRRAFDGRIDAQGKPISGILEILASVGANARRVEPPATLPDGWDLADAEADGWNAARTLAWIKAHLIEPRHVAA